jgi:lipopolysaccharide export system protein LptA
MRWQKRARFGVAVFGIACAIVVYAAIGERQTAAPPPAPARLDPKAILESEGAQVQQERGAQRDFDVSSARQLSYDDGSTKMVEVVIRVRGRSGRDYVLKGREATAGKNQRVLELAGDVRLEASDGFELHADSGSFNQDDGMVRVPGEVTFARGRMSGGGVGMTYDETNDVISIGQRARFVMAEAEGQIGYSFDAGAAVLDRRGHVLALEGEVRGLRGEQRFEGDRAVARMTAEEDAVNFIELRGNATVSGGDSTLDTMTARDIDLDYTERGDTLERVRLDGGAAVALKEGEGAAGRQIVGETLDLTMAPDGAVTRAVGRENVRLDLPAADGTAPRSVKARSLDAAGEPGRGLTQARFEGDVEYQEQAARITGRSQDRPLQQTDVGAGLQTGPARRATSRVLSVSMDGNAINAASFTGAVTFEEQGLKATAAEARYEPAAGTLRLTGTDAGGPPRVADGQVTIEAQKSIDVTLAGRRMQALGGVKTLLRSGGDTKLPGLLQADAPANVKADVLDYEGGAGRAVYDGNAELWQGQTAIRAATITLDQKRGNLLAAGAARATLALDTGNSVSRAEEIRYDDATRVIGFAGAEKPPSPAQVNGPQGQIVAARIEIALAREGNRAERLEAYTNVSARVDTRTATGARLTYFAADERYVMTAANAVPVRVLDGCRETEGNTLTFFKTADRIIVDGNEQIRTQTRSGGPCAATPAR